MVRVFQEERMVTCLVPETPPERMQKYPKWVDIKWVKG